MLGILLHLASSPQLPYETCNLYISIVSKILRGQEKVLYVTTLIRAFTRDYVTNEAANDDVKISVITIIKTRKTI